MKKAKPDNQLIQKPVNLIDSLQKQGYGCKINDNQNRLQCRDTTRVQPVAEQKDKLRSRGVDSGQFRIVNAVKHCVKRRRNHGINKKGFGRNAIRRASRRETVAISGVTIEIVFKKRSADQPEDSEYRCPEEHATERKPLPASGDIQIEAEYRKAGPCHEKEE